MNEPLINVRVAHKVLLAQDILFFELVAEDGRVLPAFAAGAHIDVHVSLGGTNFVRPYSLCNTPGEPDFWHIAVLREAQSRGGSAALHA